MPIIKRTWTNPLTNSLRGTDGLTVRAIFESLTEYLRGHIGVWGTFEGTTDASGNLMITHNAGFTPAAILVSEIDAGDPTKMGPFHIQSYTDTVMDLHFFDKSGNDRTTHEVSGFYHILPPTNER
jgi:hypothetical protein